MRRASEDAIAKEIDGSCSVPINRHMDQFTIRDTAKQRGGGS